MDKKERKSRVIIRIELTDATLHQKILAEYLKRTGEAKSIAYRALSSQLLPIALALSSDPNVDMQELECTARKNRREMLNHISSTDDFFMLNFQIDLQSDRPQNDRPNPSIKTENTLPFKHEEDEDEDEDDLSDLSNEEYLERIKSRIDNPQVKD